MSGVAAAIAGSAVVGAVVSDRASKRAAGAAKDSSEAQLAFMREQADRAREDVARLSPQAREARDLGYQQSMDFLGSALPVSLGFMQQGNVGAQEINAAALPQMNNAILGGPIDYSFAQPRTIDFQPALQDLLAGVPQVYQPPQEPEQQTPANPTGGPSMFAPNFGGFGGMDLSNMGSDFSSLIGRF